MAGQRQPTDLLLLKGKKHLTKAEIEERKRKEVKAKKDKIKAPNWLNKSQKLEFNAIAKELIDINIMSNLDNDALAFFIKQRNEYIRITEQLESRDVMILNKNGEEEVNESYERLHNLQQKALTSCRKCASDLGLTISSRCRLVVPTAKEEQKQNKFSKFM